MLANKLRLFLSESANKLKDEALFNLWGSVVGGDVESFDCVVETQVTQNGSVTKLDLDLISVFSVDVDVDGGTY